MSDTENGPEKRTLEDGAEEDAKRPRLNEEHESATSNGEVKPEPEHALNDTEMADDNADDTDKPVTAQENGDADDKPAGDALDDTTDGGAASTDANTTGTEPTTGDSGEPSTSKDDELTPLERAQRAANDTKVVVPEDLDPTDGPGLPKHQHKYILSAIKAIKRLKDASPFLHPVDPERLGIPQYFDYIKQPMDLSTIENNLMAMTYERVHEVVDHFNLMVSNAIVFNGEESQIAAMGVALSNALRKHLTNMPLPDELDAKKRRQTGGASSTRASIAPEPEVVSTPVPVAAPVAATPVAAAATSSAASSSAIEVSPAKQMQAPGVPVLRRESAVDGRPKREIHPPKSRDLPYGDPRPRNKKVAAELKFAGQIIRELTSRKHENISYPFLQPVDPVALGIPNYFDVVKEPMDLGTIQLKLNEGAYYNADDFEADMRLMFRNCYAFNPAGTPVNDLGHKLENLFDKRWHEKPQPAPTPPPMSESESSDYDEEYDEAGITNPAIKVLEEQMAMIKQQLRRLKRDALQDWRDKRTKKKGSRASTGGSVARRASHAAADRRKSNGAAGAPRKEDPSQPLHITYEMKKELSEKIGTLPEKKLRKVVSIIQDSMPQLANSGQEEIELDMDQLEPSTLRQLYNYVVRRQEDEQEAPRAPVATVGAGATGVPQKKKKSKPLSEDEQNRQIEEIQSKLRQFEQMQGNSGDSLSPTAGAVGGIEDSSSDDDDDNNEHAAGPGTFSDDSSSEEE